MPFDQAKEEDKEDNKEAREEIFFIVLSILVFSFCVWILLI